MLTDLNALWSQPVNERRHRESSYDRSGGNADFIDVEPGKSYALIDKSKRTGVIQRIWITLQASDDRHLQNISLTGTFDGKVTFNRIPFGMFMATGPWRVNDINSAAVNIMRARRANEDRLGCGLGSFNLHWAMPFDESVKIEIHNQCTEEISVIYYVDYIECDHAEQPLLFHIQHRYREPMTDIRSPRPKVDLELANTYEAGEAKNLTGEENYEFVNISNCKGRYVGTVLAVESHPDRFGKWYEGDDMFFIDGETWPPSLHGTGTEDYFGMAWGVHRWYQAPDHGITHYEKALTDHDRFYDGRYVLYRWHLNDPIAFQKSLRASIEVGHANESAQYYESTAFYYALPL